MIRAVVDTSVLVSAFIGHPDAAPARVVQAIRDGRVVFVASPQLLAELAGVLERPKVERWAAGGRGKAFAAGLAAVAEIHPDVDAPAVATRDRADDYLVALALAHGAELIVSLDRDLLDEDVGIATVSPAELLQRLG